MSPTLILASKLQSPHARSLNESDGLQFLTPNYFGNGGASAQFEEGSRLPTIAVNADSQATAVRLEHDPEKWIPVFRKRSCANNKLVERDDDSKKSHHALGGAGSGTGGQP